MSSWQTPNHRTLRDQTSAADARRRMPASLWLTAALVLVLAATALSAGARVLADAAVPSTGEWAERAAGRPTPGPGGVGQPSPQPTAAFVAAPGGCPPQSARAPVDWPLAMCDTFDDNRNNWQTGATKADIGFITKDVVGGTFVVDVDAQGPLLNFSLSPAGSLSDFYVAVDARIVSGPAASVEYGLVFRQQSDDDQYFVLVSEANGALLYREVGGDATIPVNRTPAPALRPTDWNRVGLEARGTQLTLYINDQPVITYTDSVVLSGQLGLIARVASAGHGVLHFDNFEVRVPSAAAAPVASDSTVGPSATLPQAATSVPQVQAGLGQCPPQSASAPLDWSVVRCDTFDDNRNNWKVGTSRDEASAEERNIVGGIYRWDIRAFDTFLSPTLARFDPVADFYVAVDVRRSKGPVRFLRYGLQFRYDETKGAFMVLVSDDGTVMAYRSIEGGWLRLTSTSVPDAVRPGDWNRIAVMGVGADFVVYVNDQAVAAIYDENLPQGRFRIAVEIAQEDDYIVEFDNFEVRTAPPDAALTPMPTPLPTPTDTPTTGPTPSPSPAPRPLPTPPAEVSVVSCPLGSPGAPADWPLLLCDSFDDNANNWEVGPFRDERFDVTINADIANGIYTWDLDLGREWAVIKPCSIGVLADFYAAVDIFISEQAGKRVNYGLHFRSSDQGGYYALMVVNNTHVIVFRSLGDQSANLLAQEMPDGVFQPGGWNRLAVMATGPAIAVFVNGWEAGRFSDPFISDGELALFSSNMVAGQFVLHFDNFEVRAAPSGAQLPSPTRPAITSCPDSPAAAPADWPIFACDTFDENSYGWRVGPDPLADVGESFLSIKGNYTWTYKTRESLMTGQEPLLTPVSDFFVSVRGKRTSLMEKSSYGLMFRMKDYSNFFAFTVNDSQQYGVQIWVNGFRRQLVEPTYSPVIRPNEANVLAVRGEGRRFTLYINDQQVDELYDIHFKEGKVGLIAFLERADEGRIEFDNFEVRTPPGR